MDHANTIAQRKVLAKWETIKRQHEIGLAKANEQLKRLSQSSSPTNK